MAEAAPTVQLLSPDGVLQSDATAEQYRPYIDALSDEQLRQFHRDMV
ncbi:MAG: 2-oxoisovalerate dehydrogenase component alpha subunit, partial [Microbacteriaceae bacterium]|nr:2-oxoisovalerate dehydrogenase component alpha subunit [Microbacteriaceae bacterium]